jgi:hypothetical protein
MLVKCVCSDIRNVASGSELGRELGRSFGTDTHHLELTVGGLYVVYGLEIKGGWIRYFVADDAYSSTLYPVAYLATFFDVVDRRVSRCWTIGCRGANTRSSSEVLLAFEEWSRDATFYERLVDGAAQEQAVFRDRKEFMDLEFPNPSIADGAEVLDGGWLLCPKCGEAWESQTAEGMTRCPKCRVLLSNPLFVMET